MTASDVPQTGARPAADGVLATFDDSGTSVKVTDVKTNLGRTLTLEELKAVTRIDTMTAAD